MSRHNRRRTRGGRKHSAARSVASSDASADSFDHDAVSLVPAIGQPGLEPVTFGSLVPDVVYRMPATPQRMPLARSSSVSARAWHNRYIAWQNRDRKQREEMAKLEAEKARMFGSLRCGGGGGGGEDDDGVGDDADGLEEKMLEYFGGLEWLDT